ncbi:sugar MFS transporter [Nocardioides sp. cx-173]|uniref:MFS transporter n=1 Tax=Nocardioides sp. cx-173 TaxID=2898796 RepID=UPI001E2B76C6|nr:MFS transporter [Nocardioides sp. cx-173]MCD4524430.1 MFS transporter [Nocardioides sp. cx-173]UGB43084.1 MFS transporter [Nocardioides sp. cx-173]
MAGRPPGSTAQGSSFVRDSPTVLSYAALLCFAFWVYGYGPALSLLRDDLRFSYTVLGAYTAAWSAGTVLTGLLFPTAARLLPRAALLWGSSIVATAGLALFVLGSGVGPTLAGGAVLGVGGTMLLTTIQALLSDTHAELRERALVEANIGAAACAVAAPLALGALAVTAVGWRAAFAFPAVALAALYLCFRRLPLPAASPHHGARPGPLPTACWLYAGLAAASMAVEFCLAYFGTEQLKDNGLATSSAVLAMSSHYVGLLLGRIVGAVATGRPGRSGELLYASLVATAGGFALFWLASDTVAVTLGLFVAGLGIANLYPLAVALSLAAAPGREDQANSRSQLLGGLLVVAAPYALGSLADRVGLTRAYAIEPVLIALCLILLLAGNRARRRSEAT